MLFYQFYTTNTSVTLSNLIYTVDYIDPSSLRTVTFLDWDGTVLKTQQVEVGTAATAPADPTRNGYNFIGWDVDFHADTNKKFETIEEVEKYVKPSNIIASQLSIEYNELLNCFMVN